MTAPWKTSNGWPRSESADGWRRDFFRRPHGPIESPQSLTAGPGTRTRKMARLEAVLFVAEGALPPRRLAQLASLADATEARTLVKRLNDAYDACRTAFRIEQVAAGYQLLTLPALAHWLGKLHQRQAELKLTPSALETLAIVAYRQPITRADVEAVRGVSSLEILRQLLGRGLIRIGGAEDSLGRPHLYETTPRFLETFGLRALEDLPRAERLRRAPAA